MSNKKRPLHDLQVSHPPSDSFCKAANRIAWDFRRDLICDLLDANKKTKTWPWKLEHYFEYVRQSERGFANAPPTFRWEWILLTSMMFDEPIELFFRPFEYWRSLAELEAG
jgi:hypothetical protein